MPKLTAPTRRSLTLNDADPSFAAESAYRKRMDTAVKAMAKSVEYWIGIAYRRALETNADAGNVPEFDADRAQDASPFGDRKELFRQLTNLQKRWERYFASKAKAWATDVVNAAYAANKTAWQQRTKREGFDVPMQLSERQRTIMDVKVGDNVALIRSIPEQYFTKITGDVSRGFLAGRDLEAIAKELRHTGETTTKRAALIARDQSNKLTAQMNSARQSELGVSYAYWKHSTAGKEPRPTHVRAGREKWIYDTQVGIDFGDAFGFVLPGVAINCRCGSRSIIPGLDEEISASDLEPVAGFPGAFRMKAKR